MKPSKNQQQRKSFQADCERIHREWHERAKVRDTEGLLVLYAEDAVLESPLVPASSMVRPWECYAAAASCADSSTRARAVDPTTSCAGIARAIG